MCSTEPDKGPAERLCPTRQNPPFCLPKCATELWEIMEEKEVHVDVDVDDDVDVVTLVLYHTMTL